jgi:predicted nucleic acid-binding protein
MVLKLREAGTPIPAIDIFIWLVAAERNMQVVSDDSHFEIFKKLDPRIILVNFDECMKQILETETQID